MFVIVYPQMKRHMLITLKSKDSATLQVKVFARLTFGNQVFWFRETFLQIKPQLQNFRHHGVQNDRNLEGCSDKILWKVKAQIQPLEIIPVSLLRGGK